MQNKIILTPGYSNPLVESTLNTVTAELEDYVTIKAKSDSQKEADISEPAFRVTILDFIQAKIQQTIDSIRQNLLVASGLIKVREFEINTKKQCEQNKNEITDKKLRTAELERRKAALKPDRKKMRIRRGLFYVALFVGLADACLAFSSFRQASYSVIMALIASVAIFGVISISNLILVPLVKNAQGALQKRIRIGVILLVSFFFFFSIASLRATGINSDINVTVNASETPQQNVAISAWPICLISYTLFSIVFLASLFFWQKQEEKMQEQEYKDIGTAITALQKEINELEKKTKIIETDIIRQKDEARELFDYYKKTILRIKNTGTFSVTLYKKTYASFTATIPGFFSDKHDFIYDEEINFFNPEKQEL
jgi:hypothetical protein